MAQKPTGIILAEALSNAMDKANNKHTGTAGVVTVSDATNNAIVNSQAGLL
jgi:hypothetical protein